MVEAFDNATPPPGRSTKNVCTCLSAPHLDKSMRVGGLSSHDDWYKKRFKGREEGKREGGISKGSVSTTILGSILDVIIRGTLKVELLMLPATRESCIRNPVAAKKGRTRTQHPRRSALHEQAHTRKPRAHIRYTSARRGYTRVNESSSNLTLGFAGSLLSVGDIEGDSPRK